MEWISDCGSIQLYCGDALKVLTQLKPKSVDAVVMDPPYILSDSGPGESHFGMSLNKFDSDEFKSIVSGFDVPVVFELLENVCSPFNMFCFCSNRQISTIMHFHEQRNRSVTLCIWHKTNAAPFANGVWRGDIEYVVHAKDKRAVFVGDAIEKKKVFEHPIVQGYDHPTVKPLSLIVRYVEICSMAGQVVLDPFMGSGTTGVACARTNRKFIGIEKEVKYFEIAKKRISNELNRFPLFIEQENEQVELF